MLTAVYRRAPSVQQCSAGKNQLYMTATQQMLLFLRLNYLTVTINDEVDLIMH